VRLDKWNPFRFLHPRVAVADEGDGGNKRLRREEKSCYRGESPEVRRIDVK
jgi:hypothetical protein